MYSVVVMMALSGGVDAPDLGGRRCHNCSSSCSYCASSCAYSCSSSCHGRRRHRDRCHGCSNYCHTTYCCTSGTAPKEMKKDDGKKPDGKGKDGKEEGRLYSAPATIVVNLPADAKLMVDNQPTTSTSARRVFTSPALTGDQDYTYTFKAELTREGKTESVTKIVNVRAGETTNVDIAFAPSVASK
jgi:uncharacterized protein (TIGR03000 family)